MTQEAVVMDVEGQLTMAGKSKPVKAQLLAYSLNGKVMVSTRKPILIKADDFGLTEGVEALREIMGLNFLGSTVPVTFQLELSKPATKAAMSALPPSAW
jgi:polyisoprenoid-binding protein YceI